MLSATRLAGLGLVLFLAAGCTSGNDNTGTASSEPSARVQDIVESSIQARVAGDVEAWQQTFSDDARFVSTDGTSLRLDEEASWISDDFDGDGVISYGDSFQFQVALAGPTGLRVEWECVTVSDDEAECTSTETDALAEAAGVPMATWADILTVENGQIVEVRNQTDPAASSSQETDVRRTSRAYEYWVWKTYPDRYATMFHGPCCRGYPWKWVLLPTALPDHEELIPEYIESTR